MVRSELAVDVTRLKTFYKIYFPTLYPPMSLGIYVYVSVSSCSMQATTCVKIFDVVGRLAYCNCSLSVGDCFSGAGAWRVVGPQRG